MLSIVYSSVAVNTFDDSALTALLTQSRTNNTRLQLTGLLVYKDDHFLQLLEGPDDAVRERMVVITADPRHRNVVILYEEETIVRRFPEWTMGYQPVTDALADTIPGYRSTFHDLETDQFTDGSREVLRGLMAWYQTSKPPH